MANLTFPPHPQIKDPDEKQTKILYTYNPSRGSLTRKVGSGHAHEIIDDIVSLKFVYYNAQEEETTKLIDTKKVELQMTL